MKSAVIDLRFFEELLRRSCPGLFQLMPVPVPVKSEIRIVDLPVNR